MAKFIITVGGVYSGVGKGIASASIAFLMSLRGQKVTCIKFDPYINTSASVLSPGEHGESYCTDDGWECDLDLGNYERLAGIPMSRDNICTSGSIYEELIEEQKQGKYLGQTVQINPHFSDKVKEKLLKVSAEQD